MAFIKTQKLVLDKDGKVVSGSASIIETTYSTEIKGRSKHTVREKLGKVIFIDEDKKCGIFLSPSRGLIGYDSKNDTFIDIDSNDERLSGHNLFSEPMVHTMIGDSYLLLEFMKKNGFMEILKDTFSDEKEYQRVLAHIIHTIVKDGSKIHCNDFAERNFLSYLIGSIPIESLQSDTTYFSILGKDCTKISFFKNYVAYMRKKNENFGRACYVDSTPLPSSITDNPFNYLCSHGTGTATMQCRMVLVLDEETGLPVWYSIIPGNVLDLSTITKIQEDVAETLDIRIDSLILDAGYTTKELIEKYHIEDEKKEECDKKDENVTVEAEKTSNDDGNSVDADNAKPDDKSGEDVKERKKTFISRMPAKKGYPYKSLYNTTRKLMNNAKYEFIRGSHTYFGIRREIELFGKKEYAYIYVDRENALDFARENKLKDPDSYEKLSDAEKNWFNVKFGYFVLLSNDLKKPDELLDKYFSRTEIESVFKTSKEYLDLLPLRKWSDLTVRGKILSDIISAMIYLGLRKKLSKSGCSVTRLLGKTSSLMCMKKSDGTILVETANKQTKEVYSFLEIKVPSTISLEKFKKDTLLM